MPIKFFFLLLALFPVVAMAESTQCKSINAAPYTITSSGYYCLTNDLSSNASNDGAAITITADNVQLDLNGHSIVGSGMANLGRGISALGRAAITVRNGYIRNFWIGVMLDDPYTSVPPDLIVGASKNHEISQLHVDSTFYGILVRCYYCSVHDNIVTNSAGAGIQASASTNPGITGAINVISNQVFATNTAAGSSNVAFGIEITGSTGSVVQGNVISQVHGPSGSAGIYAVGVALVVSGNRETDITGSPVFCAATPYTVAKVEGNIDFVSNTSPGNLINGCSQPTGSANNNY